MRSAVFIVSLGFGALALAGAGMAQDVSLPDGPGKDKLTTSCTACHGLDQVTQQRKTREQWSATVEKMIENGAALTQEDTAAIVDYLGKNFAPPAAAGVAPAKS
jgi:mono/diheme cytochrome c family protein